MMPRGRRFAVALLATASAAACRDTPGPRRVPDDGAPCSVVMPAAPEVGQVTYRLGSVNVAERAWGLRPSAAGDPAPSGPRYYVRRATLPANSPVRDEALLEAAASRVGKGIALEDNTKPAVATVQTEAGPAIELRWTVGKAQNATRLLLTPSGYCEATILGAPGEAAIASYFATVQVRTDAKP